MWRSLEPAPTACRWPRICARGVEYQIFGEPMGSWKSWKNNMPGAKLGELQGLVLGWTFDLGIEGACAALVLAFATKLDSAAGPVREGRAQSPLQT